MAGRRPTGGTVPASRVRASTLAARPLDGRRRLRVPGRPVDRSRTDRPGVLRLVGDGAGRRRRLRPRRGGRWRYRRGRRRGRSGGRRARGPCRAGRPGRAGLADRRRGGSAGRRRRRTLGDLGRGRRGRGSLARRRARNRLRRWSRLRRAGDGVRGCRRLGGGRCRRARRRQRGHGRGGGGGHVAGRSRRGDETGGQGDRREDEVQHPHRDNQAGTLRGGHGVPRAPWSRRTRPLGGPADGSTRPPAKAAPGPPARPPSVTRAGPRRVARSGPVRPP